MSKLDLSGRVAVVTGAGQGIGAATARTLAAEGAAVVLADVNAAAITALAQELQAQGRTAIAIPTDVTQAAEVARLFTAAAEQLGPVGIACHIAGVQFNAAVPEMTEAQWDRMLNVHLKGTFLCAQAAFRQMAAQRYGRIVNIASMAAFTGPATASHYAAAKAGIIGFTRALAKEGGPYNIRANVVAPGIIETAMSLQKVPKTPEAIAQWRQESAARVPLGRVGRPEDVADTILYLVSDLSDYITGQTIHCGGGITMG